MSNFNVNPDSVRQIVEMGFSEEQAAHALKLSNGDVSDALNLIFQSPDLAEAPQGDAPSYEGNYEYPIDEKHSAPIEAGLLSDKLPPAYDEQHPPPVPARHPRDEGISHIENTDNVSQSHVSLSDSGYLPDADDSYVVRDYSIYDDISKYQRDPDLPPVLMPIRNGQLESYLNPLLTILHEIPVFREKIYQQEFKTLGFHPRWFKGEPVKLPEGTASKVKNGEEHNLGLLLEVQRLFAFLDGDSTRSFSSINNFVKAFPKESQGEFYSVENIHEAYSIFYKALCTQLEIAGVENSLSFFESTLTDGETPADNRSFGMFHVEGDELDRDLYRTIHNILWGDELENTQNVLTSISDVVTISFESSVDGHSVPVGIEISDKFYPQVYSSDFKETISDLINQRKVSDKERRTIARELLNLRAFGGKNVSALMNTSIEFLTDEAKIHTDNKELADALNDLESIRLQNQEKIGELNEKQAKLLDERTTQNPFDIKVILKHHESTPEPYILTGAIINEYEYFFLRKPQELIELDQTQWVRVAYGQQQENNVQVELTDFEFIKRSVFGATHSPYDTSVVLVYVKESTWLKQANYEISDAIKTFVEKDKAEIEKALEILESSDSSEDEPVADGEDEDEHDGEDANENGDKGVIELEDSEKDQTPPQKTSHPTNPFR